MGALSSRVARATTIAAAVAAVAAGAPALATSTGPAATTASGVVEVLASSGGTGSVGGTVLRTRDGAWRLSGAAAARLRTGGTVRVSGLATGRTLAVTTAQFVSDPPPVATTGTQSVYVVRAYWDGHSPDGTTHDQAVQAMQQAGQWFNEVSYGMIPGFDAHAGADWVHIPAPSDCAIGSNGGLDQMWTNALTAQQAADASFNPNAYQHVIVYFPVVVGCSFAGLGDVGGQRVWLNGIDPNGGGSSLDLRVSTHELGHNLGLSHSHSVECFDGSNTPVTVSSSCAPFDDYGDPSDVMGGGDLGLAPHYSASQKEKLGWLGANLGNAAPCTSVALAPYEAVPGASGGKLAVAVDAGADPATGAEVTYWLEYRHPAPGTVDAAAAPEGPLPNGLTDGVLLHRTLPANGDEGPSILDGTPATGGNFDDAAITAGSAVTTPEGDTFTVGAVTADIAPVTLTSVHPSVPVNTSARYTAAGDVISWAAPRCDGGHPIVGYGVSVDNGAPTSTSSTSLTPAGIDRTRDHTFRVFATNAGSDSSRSAVVPVSAPTITGSQPTYYGNGARIAFAPSVSNGGHTITGYYAVGTPVGGGATQTNFYDLTDVGTDPGHVFVPMNNGVTYRVTLAPVFDDSTDGPASAPVTMVGGDDQAPSVSVTAPTATVTKARHVTVRWSGHDLGGGTITSYDVEYRVAASTGGFGAQARPSSWQHTRATSAVLSVAAGSTYCFSVRARDTNGNVSGWSKQRCTAVPLDDRALTAGSGWSRATSSAAYAGTLTTARRSGVALTRTHVHARHLWLVVTTCSSCGSVSVYAGSTKLATVALTSSSTRYQVLVSVPVSAALSGTTVSIKTTSTRSVMIDGLAVSAT